MKLSNTERSRLIDEIIAMRKERAEIKHEIAEMNEKRGHCDNDFVFSSLVLEHPSTKSIVESALEEINAEKMQFRKLKAEYQHQIIRKKLYQQKILEAQKELQNYYLPKLSDSISNLHHTNLAYYMKIKDIAYALIELSAGSSSETTGIAEKINNLVAKNSKFADTAGICGALRSEKIKLEYNYFEMIDTIHKRRSDGSREHFESQIRRRTSDLFSESTVFM